MVMSKKSWNRIKEYRNSENRRSTRMDISSEWNLAVKVTKEIMKMSEFSQKLTRSYTVFIINTNKGD